MHTNRSKERSLRIGINARLLQKGRKEGIARYIFETTRCMIEKHPEHEFVFFFDRDYDPAYVDYPNAKAVKIGLPARHPVLFKLWFDYSLPPAIKAHGIDVMLHGDSYASLRSKVPYVLVSHDLAFIHYPNFISPMQRMYYDYYFPRFHRKAQSIVAVSQATKDDIIAQYHIAADKIHVGYNATPSGFQPLTEAQKQSVRNTYTEGRPYFIYLGSLHPRKNIDKLILAFDIFKKENNTDHQLLIVGRKAWKYGDIDKAYQGSPYQSEIHFLHDIEEEAKLLMASADALTYVSLFEGFGIPILEGFSTGIPVITSNVSSMPEVAGDSAILVNPKEPKSIAHGMTQLIKNTSLRNQLISKGLARKEQFNWENTADIIYEQLIQATR